MARHKPTQCSALPVTPRVSRLDDWQVGARRTVCVVILASLLLGCEEKSRPAGVGRVIQLAPELATIVPADAKLEKIHGDFDFLEGPVWSSHGYLLFSDMTRHLIYQWTPPGRLSTFRDDAGEARGEGSMRRVSGPNGLAFDREGRLTICEHGHRRVTRLEKDGRTNVLAEHYRGRRLNSPNDLVYRSDGALFFTDPPFGLPGEDFDPQRELDFSGIYLLFKDDLILLNDEIRHPNGLALSPDESHLYIDDGDSERPAILRYRVHPDGSLSEGTVFFEARAPIIPRSLDGIKVDMRGNVYVSTSAGVLVLSPEGRHLGTIHVPEQPTNIAWGDEDGKTLYVTAITALYRIRLEIPGSGLPWLGRPR